MRALRIRRGGPSGDLLAGPALGSQLIGAAQFAHDVLRGMPLPTSHVFHRPFQPDIGPQDSKTRRSHSRGTRQVLDHSRGQIDLDTASHVGHPQVGPCNAIPRPGRPGASLNSQVATKESRSTPMRRRRHADLGRRASTNGQPAVGIEKRSTGATPKQLHPACDVF